MEPTSPRSPKPINFQKSGVDPAISSLSPNPASPGDTIAIIGTDFGSNDGGYVSFSDNGVDWATSAAPGNLPQLQLQGWGNFQILFVVPAQATVGTTALVRVTAVNNGKLRTSTGANLLVIAPPPAITSLNPVQAGPGDTILITGKNFGAGGGYVAFWDNGISWGSAAAPGNLPQLQLGGWGDTQIKFVVPVRDTNGNQTQPASTATVSVTTASGAHSNGKDLALIGGVTSVSPSSGLVPMLGQQGTEVTIAGGGFGPGTTVAFGADAAIAPTSVAPDGTSLSVMVPPTAASGPLTVTLGTGSTSAPFTFAVDNYRNTRGLSWANTGSPGFQSLVGGSYSYDDATALFGEKQTGEHVLINLKGPLVTLLLTYADLFLDSGGQCFGMSLGSLQFAAGLIGVGGFPQQPAQSEPNGPPGPDVWTLNGPPLGNNPPVNVSPSLAGFVHQRHLAQLSHEYITAFILFHDPFLGFNVSSAAGLRNAIQQAFTAGGAGGAGAIVCLQNHFPLGDGHAVVAYGIVDTGNGNFDILMYNPNIPFQAGEDSDAVMRATNAGQSVINVRSDGTWTLPHSSAYFAGASSDWTGGINDITVVPWNTIPFVPTFPWAEVVGLAAILLLIVTGDASMSQVSDGQGHLLLANGEWNIDRATMLSGARVMPNFGGLGKKTPPAFVSNRPGALINTIAGGAQGAYDFHWLGRGGGGTLSRVPTTRDASDTVIIDSDKVSFTADRDKTLTITLLGSSLQNKFPRTATLKTTASRGGAVRLTFDSAADTFSYDHAGSPVTYTLELSSLDARGKATSFTTSPVFVAQGETHTFAPDWAQLGAGIGTLHVRTAGGTVTHRALK